MYSGSDVTANGLRRLVAGMVVSLASMLAVAAPTAAAKQAGGAVVCKAQSTAAGLEVRCPTATVAELLAALQRATGLRSEYPKELGQGHVSVTRRHASLLEVLESALPAYNFAVWTDQQSPSVTWVRVVELRRTIEEGTEQPPAQQEIAKATPAAVPRKGKAAPTVSTAALLPPNIEEEMAQARDNFARSISPATPLEVPTPAMASGMLPEATSPVVMKPSVSLR
jgi:hypothetical protein